MTFTVETEQETDGRWIAEIAQIPGALTSALPPAMEQSLASKQSLCASSPNK